MKLNPNILLIWTDEQRRDTMSCYGNTFIDTPHLNRLAAESSVFEHAYCTQPICTPSRASILTGMWPHSHRCVKNNTPLPSDQPTIAEMTSGYHCAYYGKWHLGDEIVAQRGFSDWCSIEDGIYRPYFSKPEYLERFSDYHYYLQEQGYPTDAKAQDGARVYSRNGSALLPAEHTKAGFLGRKAASFLETVATDSPWFLSVNFLEPHMPFFGPYNGRHSPEEIPVGPAFHVPPSPREAEKKRTVARKFRAEGFEHMPLKTEKDWRRMRANYYGLVSLVDESVGRILDALERSGQAENTVIIYTSDHGEMMGDHDCLTKNLTYEESVGVPLMIRIPGRPGRKISGRVSQVDLAPTILDLMDQSLPGHLQGRSLRPVLEDQATLAENDAFIEWNNGDTWRTIVAREGWKLNLCASDLCELYDLNSDPYELNNLYDDPSCRSFRDELIARVQAWQADTSDTAVVI